MTVLKVYHLSRKCSSTFLNIVVGTIFRAKTRKVGTKKSQRVAREATSAPHWFSWKLSTRFILRLWITLKMFSPLFSNRKPFIIFWVFWHSHIISKSSLLKVLSTNYYYSTSKSIIEFVQRIVVNTISKYGIPTNIPHLLSHYLKLDQCLFISCCMVVPRRSLPC